MRALNRRKGIASLPIVIIFVALVAVGFFTATSLMSSQSYANYQLQTVQSLLAARQQELSGLKVVGAQQGTVQVEQTAGVSTTISKVLVSFQGGQTQAFSINPITIPSGTTRTIILSNLFGGNISSGITGITLVTDRGVYLSSKASLQSYQCPNGGTLSGQMCVQQASVNYSCPNGGTLQGTTCVQQASPKYYCPPGWTLQGTNCVQPATPIYGCPPGWYPLDSPPHPCQTLQTIFGQTAPIYNPGYWTTRQVYIPGHWTTQQVWVPGRCTMMRGYHICYPSDPTTVWVWVQGYWTTEQVWVPGYYSCPAGYTLSGSTCITRLTVLLTIPQTISGYTCPNGGTLQGTTCYEPASTSTYRYVVRRMPASQEYYCPRGGILQGTWCLGPFDVVKCKFECAHPSYIYPAASRDVCPPDWYLVGTTCRQAELINLSGYYCPSGWALNGTTCYQSATASYYCPSGWILQGAMCHQNTKPIATNVNSMGWTVGG